jgi:Tfp pilus assembly protein PilX
MKNAHPYPKAGSLRSYTNQHGVTLIMVMVFIVTLSLIAAAAMRNVGTGERVIANERDRAISLQGAESSGRDAVEIILNNKTGTLAAGYFATPMDRGGNAEFWRTTSTLEPDDLDCASKDLTKRFDWTKCSANSNGAYGNKEKPQYVIERMPNVTKTATPEEWYRITSRASGGSNEADVILQIMFCSNCV